MPEEKKESVLIGLTMPKEIDMEIERIAKERFYRSKQEYILELIRKDINQSSATD